MKVKKLNPKQQAFADFYIEFGNAEEAALKAGYSKAYARGKSYTLLANVGIKAHIAERMEELKSERVADQQEIMEFLTAIMRGEVKEPVPILAGDGEQRVVNLVPNAQARKAAAELLGKRYKLWTDKVETEVTGAVQFIDDISGGNDGS